MFSVHCIRVHKKYTGGARGGGGGKIKCMLKIIRHQNTLRNKKSTLSEIL